MTKHTPGPLLVDCGCRVKVYNDGSGVEMYYCDKHAAAPELLEALKKLVAQHDAPHGFDDSHWYGKTLLEVRAAIAKAEGA